MSNRQHLFVLFLALCLVQAAWFFVLGVQTGNDTSRYLNAAERLLTEGLFADLSLKATLMVGYSAFVAMHQLLSDSLGLIVLSQVILHIGVALLLWTVIRHHSSPWVASGLVLLFSAFPYLARWNFYILSDSLAISASAVLVYFTHRVVTYRPVSLWVLIPSLLPIALIRPHLAVMVMGFLVFMLAWQVRTRSLSVSTYAALLIAPALLLFFFFSSISFVDDVFHEILRRFHRGGVIGKAWSLDMSGLAEGGNTLEKAWLITKLAGARILAEAGMIRAYYSLPNNLHLLAYGVLIYALTTIGLLSRGHAWLKGGMLSGILANYGLIAVTYASWDGRYGLYTMPQVWVLMGLGAGWLEQRLRTRAADLPTAETQQP